MKRIISFFLMLIILFSMAHAEDKDTTFYKLIDVNDQFIHKILLGGATMEEAEAFVNDMDSFVEGFQESIYMQDIDAYFITILLQTMLEDKHENIKLAFNNAFEEEMLYMLEYRKVPSTMTYFKIFLFGNKVVVSPGESEEVLYPEEDIIPDEPEIPEIPEEPEIPVEVVISPFSDVDSQKWYADAIAYLFDEQIVSGRPDGLFYPDDNITREEALKIVVEAFLDYTSNMADYGKSADGTWYRDYLAASEYYSLISGMYNEESFLPGVYMTRQELVTVVYRAALRAGIRLPKLYHAKDYLDLSEFKFFAVEPVRELQQAGLISGVGDNKFAPANLITRAEVSKVIYGILNLK